MRLSDLNPQYSGSTVSFQCPRCQLGVVVVRLREGEAKDGSHSSHGCNRLPPDFETLTVTPSIAAEGLCRRCPGWHGFIINGEIH